MADPDHLLILPCNTAESAAYAIRERRGRILIGAYAETAIPAYYRLLYDDTVTIPYITDPGFRTDLDLIVQRFAITDIICTHPIMRLYLERIYGDRFPSLKRYEWHDINRRTVEFWKQVTDNIYEQAVIQHACSIYGESSIEKLLMLLRKGSDAMCRGHGRIVEIGSLAGRSAFVLAAIARHHSVALHCVDAWDAEVCSQQIECDPIVSADRELRSFATYKHQFLAKIHLLLSTVDCQPQTSEDAAANWDGGGIQVLHIDGNHDTEAVVRDLELWTPYLNTSALLVMDDVDWSFNPGIHSAVNQWMENHKPGYVYTIEHGSLWMEW